MTFGLPPISTVGVKVPMTRDRPAKRNGRHVPREKPKPKKDKPRG